MYTSVEKYFAIMRQIGLLTGRSVRSRVLDIHMDIIHVLVHSNMHVRCINVFIIKTYLQTMHGPSTFAYAYVLILHYNSQTQFLSQEY